MIRPVLEEGGRGRGNRNGVRAAGSARPCNRKRDAAGGRCRWNLEVDLGRAGVKKRSGHAADRHRRAAQTGGQGKISSGGDGAREIGAKDRCETARRHARPIARGVCNALNRRRGGTFEWRQQQNERRDTNPECSREPESQHLPYLCDAEGCTTVHVKRWVGSISEWLNTVSFPLVESGNEFGKNSAAARR